MPPSEGAQVVEPPNLPALGVSPVLGEGAAGGSGAPALPGEGTAQEVASAL